MTGLHALEGAAPDAAAGWVAPGAHLIGKVVLRARASVWFNAVLRGDNERIVIGEGSNIQDGCVLHTDMGSPLTVGANCTVGHLAILHGCTIGDGALIGMGSMVMNGARVGSGALIGAGALVTEGKEISDGALVMGRPGKVVRMLAPDEIAKLLLSAEGYRQKVERYRAGLTPVAG
jgi:carbonic anhydrase/acetyltransferase-like protein (isoleucine patch superfamily)